MFKLNARGSSDIDKFGVRRPGRQGRGGGCLRWERLARPKGDDSYAEQQAAHAENGPGVSAEPELLHADAH